FKERDQGIKDVKVGETLKFSYGFKNTGSADLKITHVHPTCGCTVAKWPKEAIAPGKTGSIDVEFDTKDRVGYNAKGVNIESNAGTVNLVF
ncbi:DUF1573 domain-containing protein, partial [bacterium]|nr:DUF1573 domain-containing protein [bacterium]